MVGVVYESRDQNQDFEYHVARNFAYIFSSILIVEVNPVLSIREFNKVECSHYHARKDQRRHTTWPRKLFIVPLSSM